MSKKMQSDKVLNLPAGYFGIVLGTIGMGFAWRYASQVWQVSHWLGDGLVILAMIIWGLLTSAFITRLIRFPHSVLAEVRHPVLSSFVSWFPATTMLVAIGFVPWFRPLAVCLFSFGVVVQLAYAAWQTAGLWRGSREFVSGNDDAGGDWFCSVVSPTGGVPVQFWCRGSVGLCRLANCGIMAWISP